ncbi:MAG: hypothetical protein E7439_03120 [Ruminococcaceae bacterium]|nr:hypothetical protein [Oscillospiraceae bacterium]
MKKALSLLIALACFCALVATPAQAAPDPMAVKFQDALSMLDHFYELNAEYMIRIANDYFVSWENMEPVTVPAADYEAMLHKHFVLDDAVLESIRSYGSGAVYDAASQTYTVEWTGGFGGNLPPREYRGYVKNGETYDVYYGNITYSFLRDVLPEGMNEDAYAETHKNPDTWAVEYNGLFYENGPDGWYAIASYDNYGRKYTVELNGDVVRIISCTNYTEADLPGAFDDKEVSDEIIYDIPQDSIAIPENDCFPGGTTVKAEPATDSNTLNVVNKAMSTVATKYVSYEFTATLDGAPIQPNGKLTVSFVIPADFSTDVAVYYMAPDGALTKLDTTVNTDTRTATAQLEHFSTYILADAATRPHTHSYKETVTPPTCTVEGYTTYACKCGHCYQDHILAATGHSFGQWTSSEASQEKRECSVCGHSEIRTVETTPTEPVTEPVTEAVPNPAPSQTTVDAPDNTYVIIAVVAMIVAAAALLAIVILSKKK